MLLVGRAPEEEGGLRKVGTVAQATAAIDDGPGVGRKLPAAADRQRKKIKISIEFEFE